MSVEVSDRRWETIRAGRRPCISDLSNSTLHRSLPSSGLQSFSSVLQQSLGAGTDPQPEAVYLALFAGRHTADLAGALGPGLQVLQSKQRAILQAQRVRGDRLVDGLLEGLLL